jgi:hypothetical protein
MTILALIGLALAPQVALGADRNLGPADPVSTIAVFQRVCLSPFPDLAAFKKAAESDPESFERVDDSMVLPSPGTPKSQIAEVWTSKKYNVRFLSSPDMPTSIPQPQCVVTARLAATPDAARVVADFSTALASSGATVSVKSKPAAMRWDLTAPGKKWRIFVQTQNDAGGNFMSIVLLNLRD